MQSQTFYSKAIASIIASPNSQSVTCSPNSHNPTAATLRKERALLIKPSQALVYFCLSGGRNIFSSIRLSSINLFLGPGQKQPMREE